MPMVSMGETGPPDSTDSADNSAADGPRTCIACRKAKVKCDMAVPCSRCIRRSITCVPTPPSRRGRAGERQPKRRRLQATGVQTEEMPGISKMMQYNSIVMNTCADGLDPTQDGVSEPHFGLTALCRMWLLEATRQRSCELMGRTFTIAARCGISMDAFLDAKGTSVGAAASLANLAPLLFTAGHAQPVDVATPVDVSELPLDICTAVGRTHATITEGWVLTRVHFGGTLRYFVSPAFERDIVTWDALVTNCQNDDPGRLGIELVIPPSECLKCVHSTAMMVGLPDRSLLRTPRTWYVFHVYLTRPTPPRPS
eukprot:m.369169 g.369169  ORF g.369169 m.369169 type:complete len:312 (+) comp28118_c0_seq26:193-1128(+)